MLYLKDTEKWKQFTTNNERKTDLFRLCCISKIQKNESNSQRAIPTGEQFFSCVVSQRYRKMKAIHNTLQHWYKPKNVVLYLKDTEKWKQFTTGRKNKHYKWRLCCISKIQKNESNSQLIIAVFKLHERCVVSQRYRKMKAIHNLHKFYRFHQSVVLYLKDTEKWKQFTTRQALHGMIHLLCCISKIQKNESNSQPTQDLSIHQQRCVVSQRYRKMKAIHNQFLQVTQNILVVLYLKDTEKWKQFTTNQ